MKTVGKYNKLVYGLVTGILLPALTFIVIWMIIFDGSLTDYIVRFNGINRLSSLISLSAIPNLLLFFIFIWTNRYRSARGVILATLLVAVATVLIKYL